MNRFKSIALSTAALSVLATTPLQAATINGNLVADNNAVVVLEETPGNYQVVAGSAGSWPTPKAFNFNIADLNQAGLKECRVHIIAWGDGSSAQGIAAWFAGTAGYSAYTGQTGKFTIRGVPNSVTAGNFPTSPALINNATAASIIGFGSTPAAPAWSSPGTVGGGGISGTWGPVTMPLAGASPSAYPADFRFIWNNTTLSAEPKQYRVATTSCGNLQEAVETVDVRGDHFQCYNISRGPVLKPENIVVRDQFGKAEIVLGIPLMLCNPSVKDHKGKTYKVEDQKRHLVCYAIAKQSDQQTTRRVKVANQFTTAEMTVDKRVSFCVPSYKTLIGGKEVSLD